LDIIAEAVYLVKEGVSQVLFISKGRFDQFEMATYNILREVIFDAEVVKYTTLIRTNFAEFEDEEECKKDLVAMKRESDLAEVVGSCQNRVIHVDNPPIKANLPKKLRELNKEQRIESKKKLSEYLNKNCQASFYQPPKLQQLSSVIVDYMADKLQKRAEFEKKKAELGLEEEIITEINEDNSEKVDQNKKIVSEHGKENKLTIPAGKSQHKENTLKPVIDPKELLRSGITNLRDELERIEENLQELTEKIKELEEVKKLKKEIQKLDQNIRKEVRDHILNNQANISNVLGGDIFLNIIKNDNNSTNSKKDIFDLTSELKECEHKLSKKKNNNHSLDNIERKINQTNREIKKLEQAIKKVEKRLLELKKKLLNEPDVAKQWQEQGFTVIQAQEWAESLGRDFQPEHDMAFCAWLRDEKKLNLSSLLIYDLAFIREEYQAWLTINKQTVVATDWTTINKKFADQPSYRAKKTYQQLWISQGLTPVQAQPVLTQGFILDDYMFLAWLRDSKGLKIEQIKLTEIKSLRKEYQELWRQLDTQFAEQARYTNKTYQRWWEAHGLNYIQASAWIKLSDVKGYWNPCWPWEWMQRGFDPVTASVWLAKGLTKNDYELATYAHWKNYQPSQTNYQELKTEYQNWEKQSSTQEWLDINYPLEIRNTITYLDISSKNLTGNLDLSDFVNLTWLYCQNNQLTLIKLVNCQQLKELWGANNLLTDLVLPTPAEQLTHLDLSQNNFPAQNLTRFSHLVNCEILRISNNPWTGSLTPFSSLTKLKELRIARTELTELDLASLPSSLTYLDIKNNPNLVSPDLTDGTQLVNLEWLRCEGTKLETQLEVYGEPEKDDYDNLNYIYLLKKAQQTQTQNQVEIPSKSY
jgi:hypothetical protein